MSSCMNNYVMKRIFRQNNKYLVKQENNIWDRYTRKDVIITSLITTKKKIIIFTVNNLQLQANPYKSILLSILYNTHS